MKPFTAAQLLRIWEEGLDQPLLYRALRLVAEACSLANMHEAARLSIGERDARLLLLRAQLFGERLNNLANCPQCAQLVEWEMTTHMLISRKPDAEMPPEGYCLKARPYTIRYRLPDSADLLGFLNDPALLSQRKHLLYRCVLDVKRGKQTSTAEALPDKILDRLETQIAATDPQANLALAIKCPACSQEWLTVFDIASYLWAEIDNWAKHLLQEVFILARAFGWSEHDIVSMSDRRRQLYLQMLQS